MEWMNKDRIYLLQIAQQANSGKHRRALDKLYDLIDRMIEEDELDRCNNVFSLVTPQELGIQISTGLLTISARHNDVLPGRAKFFLATREWLQDIEPLRAERLLSGLE